MSHPLHEPEWDPDNCRFRVPSRCPHPECMAPVSPTNASAAAWCRTCGQPYETVIFDPGEDLAPIELSRRAQSAHCTYTGARLTGYSALDWAEAGGGPERSSCLDDVRGAIFGPPHDRNRIEIVEDWHQPSMLGPQIDTEDYVSSVSVVRGRVVAVTARGRLAVYDADGGRPLIERPLEWPDGSTNTVDRAVRYPPGFRGTYMVVVAPHQAQFRDLKPQLFPNQSPATPTKAVPEDRLSYLGPPLGVDGSQPAFCLLQGRPDPDGNSILDGLLSFHALSGKELARCPAEGIVRPPIFDRHSGRVVWVDRHGIIHTVLPRFGEGAPETTQHAVPDPLLPLSPSERPTLVAASNGNGQTELWVSTCDDDGAVVLCHALLDEVIAEPSSWSWQRKPLGKLGDVQGFAVGIGSRYPDNAAGQLLAVATDQQVRLISPAVMATHPMRGPEGVGGVLGSWDAPVLCSAGAVARLQDYVFLDSQGIGWSSEVFQSKARATGTYERSQGVAIFGRRVFIGHGLGVRSYRLEVETSQ